MATQKKSSKYRLLGLIGRGQFGRVHCAMHRSTGQLVALKELDPIRFPTHQFLRELRFLLTLHHPNIVTCWACEHSPTGRYLVMDYCEGGTLRNLLDAYGALPPILAFSIVQDILAGLAHAHSCGIIHCDIKPENILLHLHHQGWTARLSDFGIARLSQEFTCHSGLTGSPAYMAPERFYGQQSMTVDTYAVGILLYEMLVGDRPFRGTPGELMAAHFSQPIVLPAQIPENLQTFLRKALAKLQAQRFQSAGDMLSALQHIQQANSAQSHHLDNLDHGADHHPLVWLAQLVAGQSIAWQTLPTINWVPPTPLPLSPPALAGDAPQTLCATSPQGNWRATLEITTGQLEIRSGNHHPSRYSLKLPTPIAPESLVQLIPISSKHLAIVMRSPGQPQEPGTSPTTRLLIVNRRGKRLGDLQLDLNLQQLWPGSKPYQVWATEAGDRTSLLLIQFKPLKIRRIVLNTSPHCVINTDQGTIVLNLQGQGCLLDETGEFRSTLQIPIEAQSPAAQVELSASVSQPI
ncbi:serine/threonine-protein kinase [Alkalinema sp. FACHB-956]|uniref:protein kinase domain-containing protein n=1 Tax=Alkalinema sp. FACHB-956 TaxID=2692768 RepID=UPI001682105D|nr:serine/threonine protein kinase [Alkalinema sp. FACHB-956]